MEVSGDGQFLGQGVSKGIYLNMLIESPSSYMIRCIP